MKIKFIVAFIALFAFTGIAAPGNSANIHTKLNRIKRKQISTNVIYSCLFRAVVYYDIESKRISAEDDGFYPINSFREESNISEEQYQSLKSVAHKFVSVYSVSSKKQRLNLSLLYRDELKKLLGNDFYRFDEYVKTGFAQSIVIFAPDSPSANFGSASISVNQATHQLRGGAAIPFNDALSKSLLSACSVSATMTGPNVSESGSSSGDCATYDNRPQVSLRSTAYLDNTQYCITAILFGN